MEDTIVVDCTALRSLGAATMFVITGSAVALHCCKAHAKINTKIENSTPCKIVTHEDFNLKLNLAHVITSGTPPTMQL